MNFYSYKGQEPQGLPERIRLDDGSSVTALNELTDEELHSYGFIGPVIKPEFDAETQKLVWNGLEYDIVDLTEQELSIIKYDAEEDIRTRFKISEFWNEFKRTSFSQRLRKEAATRFEINVLYSEFLSLSQGYSDINNYIDKFFLTIDFTGQEILSISKVLELYHLRPVPSEEYLADHIYDFDTDSILEFKTRPFSSWVWNGTKWVAPVPYPNDGDVYVWDENNKEWKKI